jgi:anti-sigma B factor antagonist
MQFSSELRDGVRIYRLSGNWTDGPEALRMRVALKGHLEAGERSFVVDLVEVGLINSIGLGGLVSCYSSVNRENGTLKISGLSERNRRALFVSRLVDLFEAFDDVDAAVASFAS